MSNLAIRVEILPKRYRIGMVEKDIQERMVSELKELSTMLQSLAN